MSQVSYHQRHVWISALNDLDPANSNDTYEWVGMGPPCEVMRVGFSLTSDLTNASGVVNCTIGLRTTLGTGGSTVATWRWTDTTTLVAGAGSYRDIIREIAATTAVDASTYNVGPSGGIMVLPGESLLFTMANDGDLGDGYLWIEYLLHPFAGTTNVNSFTKDTT